jgi:hypothetical protein
MAEVREIKLSIRSTSASQLQLLIPQECVDALNKVSYTEYNDESSESSFPQVTEHRTKDDLVSYWDWPAYTSKIVTGSITSDEYWSEESIVSVPYETKALPEVKRDLSDNEKRCYWDEKTDVSTSVTSDNYWYGC